MTRLSLLMPLILMWPVAHATAEPPPVRRTTYDALGTVHHVDSSKRTIVVRGSKKEQHALRTFRIDDETEIVKSRKPFAASEIRAEMRIWVYLRADAEGRPTDVARRLTIADPYPDIYGEVVAVDAKAGTIKVARRYKGSRPNDRLQILVIRVEADTQIVRGGAPLKLAEIPLRTRVAITSRRDARNKTTDTAAKITVWRSNASKKKPGRAASQPSDDDGEMGADESDSNDLER